MPHRIRTNFLVTGELVCWSTREVGTAKQRSQKRFCLADAARDKHNSGFRAVASKVIHRFWPYSPASAKSEQSRVMHPLRKIVVVRALALLLVSAALWQQQQTAAKATDPWRAPLTAPLQLINPYYQPTSDYSSGHRGIDYRVKIGDPIFAPADSVIWFNSKVVNRPVLTLRTQTGDLLEFEPACSSLPASTSVSAGQEIAKACPADANYRQHCQGQVCLHFSLRTDRGYLSPLVRYGALAPTVLLPDSYARG